MAYLIDGHNLIPKIPGFSLQTIDDENQLIELLQEFCRLERKNVEVYFDKAPPGSSTTRRFGQVVAHFVRAGSTADAAIKKRLASLGKAAPNWTVVSSDLSIQNSALARKARVIRSEDFAAQLMKSLQGKSTVMEESRDYSLSQDELQEWLDMFNAKKK